MDVMKVHVIIESKSEDYHGTYKEVIEVHSSKEKARERCNELKEKCGEYDTEYDYETFNLL